MNFIYLFIHSIMIFIIVYFSRLPDIRQSVPEKKKALLFIIALLFSIILGLKNKKKSLASYCVCSEASWLRFGSKVCEVRSLEVSLHSGLCVIIFDDCSPGIYPVCKVL